MSITLHKTTLDVNFKTFKTQTYLEKYLSL